MADPHEPSTWAAWCARAHLTVLERGWLSSNNVLFHAPGEPCVLVDTGYATHAAQTVALVQRTLAGRPLERIVNTHLHADHCGGNAALRDAWPCAIDVPSGEAAAVDRWDDDALTYRWTGQRCPRYPRSGAIDDGAWLTLGGRPWQALGAPGHDPHAFVLHDPELGLLISADALWSRGFGIVFPELDDVPAHEGFGAVRATLARLRGLRARAVIPGHGPPFTDVEAALDRADALLDALVADPERHARHAAKVLLKFHLMEVHAEPVTVFADWARATPAFESIRARYFAARPFDAWIEALVRELEAGGAAHRDGVRIVDR